MKTKNITRFIILALVSLVVSTASAADPVYKKSGKALNGYDAVAYHTQSKAVEGSKSYTYNWKGAVWQFSSEANLDAFKGDPGKYAPVYGGYCAWAVADGKLVKSDPKIFDIHDGKLYMNYSTKTQKQWQDDREGMIKRGDSKFTKLIAK